MIRFNNLTSKFRTDKTDLRPTVNSQGNSKAFAQNLACANSATDTYNMESNCVLTSITFSAVIIGGGTFVRAIGYIDTDMIIYEDIFSSVAENVNRQFVLNIPNWEIKRGQVLSLITTNGGGSSSSVNVTFIGYLI